MSDELADALTGLYARVPLGMRLGLEPMRAAVERFGHPERSFAVAHVAGTNGKGSTCAMIESIVRAHGGLRTGLYTSPHLCRFAERIRVNGEPIDDETLTRHLNEALSVRPELSFFEVATLTAFLAFRAAEVDTAVIEVGIGGRLDATNVIDQPWITAITGIGLDHQDRLGDTLDAIAREKAAIAKRDRPMVLGAMPEEAYRAALEVTRAVGGRPIDADHLPDDVVLGLEGEHQQANARVAWSVARLLGFSDEVRRRGLANARWAGRFERITVPTGDLAGPWVLDGAHNPDGAQSLVQALSTTAVGAIVFGALGDKSWREMLAIVKTIDTERVYTQPAGREPADLNELMALAPGVAKRSIDDALREARSRAGNRTVVVCGSLYLVGVARSRLLGLKMDPIVAL